MNATDIPIPLPLWVVCWAYRDSPASQHRAKKAWPYKEAARLADEANKQWENIRHWIEGAPVAMTDNVPDLPEQNKEHYLGDGVFVSFDGYQIALRDSSMTSTIFYLAPNVWGSLRVWMDRHPTLRDHMETQP